MSWTLFFSFFFVIGFYQEGFIMDRYSSVLSFVLAWVVLLSGSIRYSSKQKTKGTSWSGKKDMLIVIENH